MEYRRQVRQHGPHRVRRYKKLSTISISRE